MRAPDFWHKRDALSRILGVSLSPLGALHGLSVAMKTKQKPLYRPRARVICVGNLTAGGTGKTPIARAIVTMLNARGCKTVFLTRGYGGQSKGPLLADKTHHTARDIGDEALLLAATAPTIVARDRAAGARLADDQHADVIVMDDGFQNFAIAKDLSFMVMDGDAGFGNGRMIPAGPLREPVAQGLARADALIVMGDGTASLPRFSGPALRTRLIPNAPDTLRGKSVFAFAGIGRPEKFFATLRAMGAKIVGTQGFADHHFYSALELSGLRAAAKAGEALLVTTEKDWVRVPETERHNIIGVPVHARFDDASLLDSLLDRLVGAREEHRP
jgi:tetraacyldisaccharide 4'-kinase